MTESEHQQALDAARAALDAAYRADLDDPAYGPCMVMSQKTHKAWLVWSRLWWSRPNDTSEQERDIDD